LSNKQDDSGGWLLAASVIDARQGNSAEAREAELVEEDRQRAALDAREERAHVFLKGLQLLLAILREFRHLRCPMVHISVQDPNG